MLAEAFPRLAVRLRSIFPDAHVKLEANGQSLKVSFPNFPAWEVNICSTPIREGKEQFQVIQSSVSLRYECLQDTPQEDFLKLIAAENLGLRGVTLLADTAHGRRAIQVRTSFLGQKGRTRDEAENLAIDVLSLLRYCRLLEDRIQRSTAGYAFSYEMYHSTYLNKSLGRNRFINYARSIFEGSSERVFGQILSMLRNDYKCGVQVVGLDHHSARVLMPNSTTEILFRLPDEIPTVSCCANLRAFDFGDKDPFELVSRLNNKIFEGHFELSADGSQVSFVAWKHLTNDLRYFSLDHMLHKIHEAEQLLAAEIKGEEAALPQRQPAKTISLESYFRNAA